MAILDLIWCDPHSEDITMQALKIIHQNLRRNCPHIHASRLTALLDVVEALLHGRALTVNQLGRSSRRPIHTKHAIKQSDRLIGNERLYGERFSIYQVVARWLMATHPRPVIVVDWSDYTHNRSHVFLRAAIPAGGRSLTLYEEVHPYRLYGNRRIQRRFLKTLQRLVPEGCKPILITDAGFGGPWFQAVTALGWDYIGRLRKNVLCRLTGDLNWVKCDELSRRAGPRPRYHGEVELARANPVTSHLYLYHRRPKGRRHNTLSGRRARSKYSRKHAQRESSPWVLASSLGPQQLSAKQVIRLYRTRMQIEEAFRDIKNHRTGFSLRTSRSRSAERLSNLLLVGMLATVIAWLMGRLAEERKLHYRYQANTVRNQRVLSLFYLGCQLMKKQLDVTRQDLEQALILIRKDILKQANP